MKVARRVPRHGAPIWEDVSTCGYKLVNGPTVPERTAGRQQRNYRINPLREAARPRLTTSVVPSSIVTRYRLLPAGCTSAI